MIRSINIRKLFYLIFIFSTLNFLFARENKFFWDGNDWNKISKSVQYDHSLTYKVKSAYLLGVLDGRLFSYLNVWNIDQKTADKTFSETVDYLTIKELIKNIDYFYQDALNLYIPIPSAILIANMYAERVPIQNIELYIESTRKWINDLVLDLDTLNYTKILEEKWLKHKEKQANQFE
tara:strand:- start:350 stop:883 length:534 start_codon:yes stop_codon:yes gene_type:complete